MIQKGKALIKIIAAMLVFGLVGFIGSEVLAFLLMRSSLEGDKLVLLYEWGSMLVTLVIAFPCFVGVTKKLGMKECYLIKEQYKLSIKSHALRIALSLLPTIIMFVIIIVLDSKGIMCAEKMISWKRELLLGDILLGCFLKPITEEIMFRGIMLKNLQPYGKGFATIISTLCFVIGHGNLVNMLLAIVPGIIFANTANKTEGLKYGMLYHMIVNFAGKIVIPMIVVL